jgi:hypothetical protein
MAKKKPIKLKKHPVKKIKKGKPGPKKGGASTLDDIDQPPNPPLNPPK